MLKQAFTQLKKAEIATTDAMDHLVQPFPHGVRPEIYDPKVCEASGDQEAAETHRVRDVAFVDKEPAALLVREECFYLEPLAVGSAGILDRSHVRDKVDRLLAVPSPPSDGEDGSVLSLREENAGNIEDLSGHDMVPHGVEVKFLAPPGQRRGPARSQDVLPSVLAQKRLKIDPVEFAVAEHCDARPIGNKLPELGHQFDVHRFRKVPLLSFGCDPHNRERTLLVDHPGHKGHAPSPDDAPVDCEHERELTKAPEQALGKRKIKDLALNFIVSEPTLEPFDPALAFGVMTRRGPGNLPGDSGKVRAFAAHYPADHGGQGVQSHGQMSLRFSWKKRGQHVTDGLEPFLLSFMRDPFQRSFCSIHWHSRSRMSRENRTDWPPVLQNISASRIAAKSVW